MPHQTIQTNLNLMNQSVPPKTNLMIVVNHQKIPGRVKRSVWKNQDVNVQNRKEENHRRNVRHQTHYQTILRPKKYYGSRNSTHL